LRVKSLTEWISACEAARRLGIGRTLFTSTAKAAGIRRRQYPGQSYPLYSTEDIGRLARESVIEPEPEKARAS
jgi:hypothetical protein